MNLTLQVSLVLAILLFLGIIGYFMKRNSLSTRFSLLWIVSGIMMLIVAIFPRVAELISKVFGIKEIVNTVFALEMFFQLVILLSLTSIASSQREKQKKTAQEAALLEHRVRELEEKLAQIEKSDVSESVKL